MFLVWVRSLRCEYEVNIDDVNKVIESGIFVGIVFGVVGVMYLKVLDVLWWVEMGCIVLKVYVMFRDDICLEVWFVNFFVVLDLVYIAVIEIILFFKFEIFVSGLLSLVYKV